MEFDLAISISVSDQDDNPMIRLLHLQACKQWPLFHQQQTTFPLFELKDYGTATVHLNGTYTITT